MMVRILTWLFIFLLVVFAIVWLVGGGWQKIKAAIPHYTNPLQYTLTGVFSSGEHFNVPGTPSNFPTLTIDAPSSTDSIPSTDNQTQAQDYSASQNYDNATSTERGPIIQVQFPH